jgi:hypothetical protein
MLYTATAGSRPPLLVAFSVASEHCSILIRNRSRHTPRRADARRSWERAFVHRECRFSLRTNVVQPGAAGVSQPWYADPVANALHRHGGLTPAALGCVFASPRTLLDSRRPAFAFPNHGGLTPAALDCVFDCCFAANRWFPGNEGVALGRRVVWRGIANRLIAEWAEQGKMVKPAD